MHIAVSNANSWGKAKSIAAARAIAFRQSFTNNPALRITVWPCRDNATVNEFGGVYGVTGDGQEYRRTSRGWTITKDRVPISD